MGDNVDYPLVSGKVRDASDLYIVYMYVYMHVDHLLLPTGLFKTPKRSPKQGYWLLAKGALH